MTSTRKKGFHKIVLLRLLVSTGSMATDTIKGNAKESDRLDEVSYCR